MSRRIALKYCGGCDPGFDRVGFFRRLQAAAGEGIEWVTVEDEGFETVLVIAGCDRACPQKSAELATHRMIIVSDERRDPVEIVAALRG
jgi:hypothetical protein